MHPRSGPYFIYYAPRNADLRQSKTAGSYPSVNRDLPSSRAMTFPAIHSHDPMSGSDTRDFQSSLQSWTWTADDNDNSPCYPRSPPQQRYCFPPRLPRDAKVSEDHTSEVAHFLRVTGPSRYNARIPDEAARPSSAQRKLVTKVMKFGHKRAGRASLSSGAKNTSLAYFKPDGVIQRVSVDGKKYFEIAPYESPLMKSPVFEHGSDDFDTISTATTSEAALKTPNRTPSSRGEHFVHKHIPAPATLSSVSSANTQPQNDSEGTLPSPGKNQHGSRSTKLDPAENIQTHHFPQTIAEGSKKYTVDDQVLIGRSRGEPWSIMPPEYVNSSVSRESRPFHKYQAYDAELSDARPPSTIYLPTYIAGGVTDAHAALSSNPTSSGPAPSKPLPLLPASVIRARQLESQLRLINSSRTFYVAERPNSLNRAGSERSSNTGVRRTSRDGFAAALSSTNIMAPYVPATKRSVRALADGYCQDSDAFDGHAPILSNILQPQPRITFTRQNLPTMKLVEISAQTRGLSALQQREEQTRARKLRHIHQRRPSLDKPVNRPRETIRVLPGKTAVSPVLEASTSAGYVSEIISSTSVTETVTELLPSPVILVTEQPPLQPPNISKSKKPAHLADLLIYPPRTPINPMTRNVSVHAPTPSTPPANFHRCHRRVPSSMDSTLRPAPLEVTPPKRRNSDNVINQQSHSAALTTPDALHSKQDPLATNSAAFAANADVEAGASAETPSSRSPPALPSGSHSMSSPIARLESRLDLLERENRLLEAALMAVLKTSGKLNRCPCGGQGQKVGRSQKVQKRSSSRKSIVGEKTVGNGMQGYGAEDDDGKSLSDASSTSTSGGSMALELYLSTRRARSIQATAGSLSVHN